jgi:hypothetical protein
MNRTLFVLLVTFGLLLGAAAVPASAQFGTSPPYGQYFSPYSRPPGLAPGGGPRLSPYLEMLRGGNPAANFYLGVVPEIERRRFENQTSTAITDLARRPTTPINPEDAELFPAVTITGHPTAFMNTTGYFGTAGPLPLPSRSVPISPIPPPRGQPTRPR